MLSKRITELFGLLQCTNTDIARFAGCSPSNISRLKSGLREPERDSLSILRLARGVYLYADHENMLGILSELCGCRKTDSDTVIPAVVAWLYEERAYTLPETVIPKSKRDQVRQRQRFSRRLDEVMTLLELTNAQLAVLMNVDVSLISRYRSGVYHPSQNTHMRERLCEMLLARAFRQDMLPELAELCGATAEEMSPDAMADWLFEPEGDSAAQLAESFLYALDTLTPVRPLTNTAPPPSAVPETDRYWGAVGLQQAVLRFLSDTVREGGELMLYSDEPMDWMSGDPVFFARWGHLMTACLAAGIRIRIIHNVDRGGSEMATAIAGWVPLYATGQIEPYIFRRTRNARFYHTAFLRPGGAGILGFFPADGAGTRWYDYITDPARLEAMATGFRAMLGSASPFLRTYTASETESFHRFCAEHQDADHIVIQCGLPASTLPPSLAERMLRRAEADPARRAALSSLLEQRRTWLRRALERGSVDHILCLPDPETVRRGAVPLDLAPELSGLTVTYTPEELAEHAAALQALVEQEKNYHLTLLPESPFREIKIHTLHDAVAVLRVNAPRSAFVFTNPLLVKAVTDYAAGLRTQHPTERADAIRALETLC